VLILLKKNILSGNNYKIETVFKNEIIITQISQIAKVFFRYYFINPCGDFKLVEYLSQIRQIEQIFNFMYINKFGLKPLLTLYIEEPALDRPH